MRLPAVDLGIMAEHLPTHEGVLTKLKIFKETGTNPEVKKLIDLHIHMLMEHVRVMLKLIDPNHKGEVKLEKYPYPDGISGCQDANVL